MGHRVISIHIDVVWEDMAMQLIACNLWRSEHVVYTRRWTYLSIGKPVTHGGQQLTQTVCECVSVCVCVVCCVCVCMCCVCVCE